MNSDEPHYSIDHDLEEAEAAARELPSQIEKLRERVRIAKAELSLGQLSDGGPGER